MGKGFQFVGVIGTHKWSWKVGLKALKLCGFTVLCSCISDLKFQQFSLESTKKNPNSNQVLHFSETKQQTL